MSNGTGLELVHDPHPDDTMLHGPLVWAGFIDKCNSRGRDAEGGELCDYDYVIVGSGPSGCALARSLLEQHAGMRILVTLTV